MSSTETSFYTSCAAVLVFLILVILLFSWLRKPAPATETQTGNSGRGGGGGRGGDDDGCSPPPAPVCLAHRESLLMDGSTTIRARSPTAEDWAIIHEAEIRSRTLPEIEAVPRNIPAPHPCEQPGIPVEIPGVNAPLVAPEIFRRHK